MCCRLDGRPVGYFVCVAWRNHHKDVFAVKARAGRILPRDTQGLSLQQLANLLTGGVLHQDVPAIHRECLARHGCLVRLVKVEVLDVAGELSVHVELYVVCNESHGWD